MKAAWPALAAVCALAVCACGSTSHATVAAKCKPGKTTVDHVDYVTWCGPATATLKVGGETHTFAGGHCWGMGHGFYALDIGTQSIESKKSVKYASIEVGVDKSTRADGPHSGTVDYQFPDGKLDVLIPVTVTLAGGQTRGTYSGANVSGSFRCK